MTSFIICLVPSTGFVGEGVGFADREYLVWYILFVIFVPYAMLPLPLKWCVISGTISASCHLTVITIIKFQRKKNGVSFLTIHIHGCLLLLLAFKGNEQLYRV